MNPAASIPPAPAAPPAALARAPGGLTRRRKAVVAVEIALIAAILAFAWVRPTAWEVARARVRLVMTPLIAKLTPGMAKYECDAMFEAFRRDTNRDPHVLTPFAQRTSGGLVYSDVRPSSILWELVLAVPRGGTPRVRPRSMVVVLPVYDERAVLHEAMVVYSPKLE